MNNLRISLIIPILLLWFQYNAYSQFKKLSGTQDPENAIIVDLLQKSGMGKLIIYQDVKTKKVGNWEYYPSLQISNNLAVANVSTIPGLDSKYNFLIVLDTKLSTIIDTLGPFYDTSIDAIKVKFTKNQISDLIVRLDNSPEFDEPKYTIIEYSRKFSKFIETKSFNKD
jgi:hypothetical protein